MLELLDLIKDYLMWAAIISVAVIIAKFNNFR
ncbi:hypothetical protein SPSIL_026190 [Sporomusa silvacetica DSM 10669]|uniref:Uncharacterized protein n=1 Tax=Sporomusa silvacetica DSM 10669 TaxID=1123289 RepID=A0ABZ3ILC9_9FIRM|nr:hypothetical protein SPSIL_03580 [Sporomusa silvacetica DSM 10669]